MQYKFYRQVLVVFFILFLSFSCKTRHTTSISATTSFVDSILDETSYRRYAYGLDATVRYIDTLREKFQDTSVMSRYNFYWLYYDTYLRGMHQNDAISYVDSMLSLLENTQNTNRYYKRYIEANYYKADILLAQKRYNESYQYYYNALQYAEKYNDTCQSSYYYFRVGLVMYYSRQYVAARRYFYNSFTRTKSCQADFSYFFRQQQLLNNIGLCYSKNGQYDSAAIYYNKALEFIQTGYSLFPAVKHNVLKMAGGVVLGNLGETYVHNGHYDSAEAVYNESIRINSAYSFDNIDAQLTRVKLAGLYFVTEREQEGIELMNEVKYINDTLPDKNVMLRWNKAMWDYWDSKKQPAKAYPYVIAYHKLNEELSSFREMHSMVDIESRVNNLKDKLTIITLEEQEGLNKQYLFIAIFICLLAVIIAVLVVQYLRKSRRHVVVLKNLNEHINVQKTKLSTAFADLAEADNEKDRILKAVSHDMRSPINSSLALIDILSAGDDNLSDEQKEFISLIKKSNEHALNLTKDLLEVATLNSEKMEKATVNITAVIEERVKLLTYKAAEKSQTITFSAPADIIAIVNEEKLLRVLNNLVNNAIKFSPVKGVIHVELSVGADTFTLKVLDNGIGIPDKLKGDVFDIFSEAKRFGTSGEQPFGLGLSICKQIVEAHKGKIWLESVEGSGTTFFVEMPLH